MSKRKNNKKTELSNLVFEFGIMLALAPLNHILRVFPYYAAISIAVVTIFLWCMPIVIAFSLVSNTIFVIEILIKLLRK